MVITSLLQAKAAYRRPFSENENGSNPGVRRIQGWIEEAWSCDYDPTGRKHFKGRLLGSKKWIGTSGASPTASPSKYGTALIEQTCMRCLPTRAYREFLSLAWSPVLDLPADFHSCTLRKHFSCQFKREWSH